MASDMDRQFFVYLPASVEVNGFMQFLMCQLSERIKEMILKLGKMSSALVLGCFLCVALFSTGAFAQSASYNAAQGVTTHAWQGANAVAKNEKTAPMKAPTHHVTNRLKAHVGRITARTIAAAANPVRRDPSCL